MDEERRLPASDLVDSDEIAARLGMAGPQTVGQLRDVYNTFPKPFVVLGDRIIWSWTDVKNWAIGVNRLPAEFRRKPV